ncbi:hypothetical protein LXL04_004136 [Taraxacum kok-saghyz]
MRSETKGEVEFDEMISVAVEIQCEKCESKCRETCSKFQLLGSLFLSINCKKPEWTERSIKINRSVKWSFFSVSIASLRDNQTSQTQSAPNSVRRQTQSDVKLSPTGLSLQLSNSPLERIAYFPPKMLRQVLVENYLYGNHLYLLVFSNTKRTLNHPFSKIALPLETRVSMTYIPPDILDHILIRLNVVDLIRCKAVSKSWNAFISDSCFIKAHIHHSYNTDLKNDEIGHRRIVMSVYATYYMYEQFDVDDEYVDFHHCHLLGSSNGLVCVSPGRTEILVINPSTREVKKLTKPQIPETGTLSWGFGYDSSTNDYKVALGFKSGENCTSFQVFSLRSNIWKNIGEVNYVFISRFGVLCQGYLHWVSCDTSSGKNVIHSFHMSTEKFLEVPQPNDVGYQTRFGHDSWMRLGNMEGCLCVFRYPELSDDLWVMKEYNVMSWEMFDCSRGIKNDALHGINRLLNYVPNKRTFCYEPGLCQSWLLLGAPLYVESLVSPHFHKRLKRKRRVMNTIRFRSVSRLVVSYPALYLIAISTYWPKPSLPLELISPGPSPSRVSPILCYLRRRSATCDQNSVPFFSEECLQVHLKWRVRRPSRCSYASPRHIISLSKNIEQSSIKLKTRLKFEAVMCQEERPYEAACHNGPREFVEDKDNLKRGLGGWENEGVDVEYVSLEGNKLTGKKLYAPEMALSVTDRLMEALIWLDAVKNHWQDHAQTSRTHYGKEVKAEVFHRSCIDAEKVFNRGESKEVKIAQVRSKATSTKIKGLSRSRPLLPLYFPEPNSFSLLAMINHEYNNNKQTRKKENKENKQKTDKKLPHTTTSVHNQGITYLKLDQQYEEKKSTTEPIKNRDSRTLVFLVHPASIRLPRWCLI